jgi:hypothetical protein
MEMNSMDSLPAMEEIGEEVFYTLRMRDFLMMPDVDFSHVATLDPNIRVLFN